MAPRTDREGNGLEGPTADGLWARLAAEMQAARQAAGIRPGNWGGTPDVPWTRTHLSNLEHGRGKPTPEVAALYDQRCPHPGDRRYFRRLQAEAAAADVQKKSEAAQELHERRKAIGSEPSSPDGRPPEKGPVPRTRWAAGVGIIVGVAIGLATVLGGGDAGDSPPTGARTVCARDLVLRDSPGSAAGGEAELLRGETIEVDRYASGPEGPHAYAHGVARGREARGEGWVLASYLCRP